MILHTENHSVIMDCGEADSSREERCSAAAFSGVWRRSFTNKKNEVALIVF